MSAEAYRKNPPNEDVLFCSRDGRQHGRVAGLGRKREPHLSGDHFGQAILVGIVAGVAAGWTLSHSFADRDSHTGYAVMGRNCDDAGACSKLDFESDVFLIDRNQNRIVWKNTQTLEIEQIERCIIFDSENWRCADNTYVMRDGVMQRTAIDRQYNVYRFGWWTWEYIKTSYLLGLPQGFYVDLLK